MALFKIPSRHDRESIYNALNGDDPQILANVRNVAEQKQWRPKLKDLAANEVFSKMLDSILLQRIGLATMTPEDLKAMNLDGDISEYGYTFDPEQSIWTSTTQKEAEAQGRPWYKTSSQAIKALYDDALRDDNGKLIGDFNMDDIYLEMNKRLDSIVKQMIAEDPSIASKLAKGGVTKREVKRDDNGVLDAVNSIIPYEDESLAHKIASYVLPMRTANLLGDSEAFARSDNLDMAKAIGGDALELGLTALNPAGRVATNVAAKALSKIPLKAAMPRLAKWGGGKGFSWLSNVGENSLGNMANSMASQAYDQVADRENAFESQPFDVKDAVTAGLVAGAFPMLAGTSRGLSDRLISGKPKLRQMMADSYNSNPMGRRISAWEVPMKEVKELQKADSYNSFVNKPYEATQGAGYTHYATPKINPFKKGDMNPAEADDALLARVIKATGDEAGSKKWFRENIQQREALKNQGDLQIGNTDNSAKPYFVETAEDFRNTQGTHPVSSYKTNFAMPITEYEANNPSVLEKLTPQQKAQRYKVHRKDNDERTRRERLIKQFAPSNKDNWGSDPSGRKAAQGLDLRAEKGKTRLVGMGLSRLTGLEAPPELDPDNPFIIKRNGVPLRQRKEED